MKYYDIWQLFPKSIRKRAADRHRRFSMRLKFILWRIIHWRIPAPSRIPIIINNFNRLTYLQELIEGLERRGCSNIIILDNQSNYPPLLQWYRTCPYKIIFLDRNYGYKALWDSGVYRQYRHSFYVYTDSDVTLDKDCPDDFMAHFVDLLRRYPLCLKAGFGIRIDDLPDCYDKKEEVIGHERKFWEHPLEDGVYQAQIDTTFALYRPYCYGPANDHHMMIRTGYPYLIRHLPWYIDSSNLDEENRYYLEHTAQKTHWTTKLKENQPE